MRKIIIGRFTRRGISKVSHESCEYELYKKKKMMYTGSGCDCNDRLKRQLKNFKGITSFKTKMTKDCKDARVLEKIICETFKPPLNKRCG